MDENEIVDTANQSEETTAETGETGQVTAPVVDEAGAQGAGQQEEGEFDEITYNKEQVKIPVAERQAYLQKGYNYDKVQAKLQEQEAATKQYQERLDRVARFSGYEDHDAFMEAITQAEENQRIQTEAERIAAETGVSKEQAEQFLKNQLSPMEQRLRAAEEKAQKYEQEATNAQVLQTLVGMESAKDDKGNLIFPDLREHSDAMFAFMQELNMSPTKKAFEAAYKAVTYDSVRTKTEQEVLANVTGRGAKQVLPSGDKGAGVKLDINSMSSEEFKKFQEDVSRRAAMGEKVIF